MGNSVVVIEAGTDRDAWVPLLELADEPIPLQRYLHEGVLYGVSSERGGRPRAAVLVIDRGDGVAELRAVAVAEREQGAGLGSWLVRHVCERLRRAGTSSIVVGTASSGVRQIAFYQRLGFRLTHIEPDFFTAEKGYSTDLTENGIPTRDMVWMELVH